MILVEEAKKIICQHVKPLPAQRLELAEALHLITSDDIYSPSDSPPFDQSAMDGFAFRHEDISKFASLPIIEEIPAGSIPQKQLQQSHASRIFTGAMLPEGADSIIMQEKTKVEDDKLLILDKGISKGANIRKQGSQIKKGELALEKGSFLSPAAIGYLAGIGIDHASVIPKPRISVLVTGSELQKPGTPINKGCIFESNSFMLQAALKELQINPVKIDFVKDNKDELFSKLQNLMPISDIILLTGGISVGKYDFVSEAMKVSNVDSLFYKLKQKPGKPLFFGKKDKLFLFALPGNPASVLSCFYEYVIPAIRLLMGYSNPFLEKENLPVLRKVEKKAGLSQFLKAYVSDKGVEPLEKQESYILRSFAKANALIYLPSEIESINEGENVEVHILPHSSSINY